MGKGGVGVVYYVTTRLIPDFISSSSLSLSLSLSASFLPLFLLSGAVTIILIFLLSKRHLCLTTPSAVKLSLNERWTWDL